MKPFGILLALLVAGAPLLAHAATYEELEAQAKQREAQKLARDSAPISPSLDACFLRSIANLFGKDHRGFSSFQSQYGGRYSSEAKFITGDGYVCRLQRRGYLIVECIHPNSLEKRGARYAPTDSLTAYTLKYCR